MFGHLKNGNDMENVNCNRIKIEPAKRSWMSKDKWRLILEFGICYWEEIPFSTINCVQLDIDLMRINLTVEKKSHRCFYVFSETTSLDIRFRWFGDNFDTCLFNSGPFFKGALENGVLTGNIDGIVSRFIKEEHQ